MFIIGVGVDDGGLDAAPTDIIFGEVGESFPCMVLIFTDEEDHVGRVICAEAEGLAAEEGVARDGGAPVLLDVFHDEFRAAEVVDVGGGVGVVHGVSEITHEEDVLALVHHLPDGEGATEDAHIGVDSHDDDIGDAALFHEVEGLGGVGDGVFVVDFERGDLSAPGAEGGAGGTAVAAFVGVIDGQG